MKTQEPKLTWQEMMRQPDTPPETPRITVKPSGKPLWCAFLCAGGEPLEFDDVNSEPKMRTKK